MARCLVIVLYLDKGRADAASLIPLPPMTMPQALAPAGARFAGAGCVGEDDAYLFVSDAAGAPPRETAPEPFLPLLLCVATEHETPQAFEITRKGEGWRMRCRDMEEDVY